MQHRSTRRRPACVVASRDAARRIAPWGSRAGSRRGSLIVEVVVASALFATAVLTLGRLAQTTSQLSVHADQQLAAQLDAENILARLQAVDWEDLQSTAKKIQPASGRNVQVVVEPSDVNGRKMMHVVVSVSLEFSGESAGEGANSETSDSTAAATKSKATGPGWVTLHDWRMKAADEGESEAATEAKTDDDPSERPAEEQDDE